ncbi:hypothetical protein MBLNU459_g1313t1 [Dothideomycetes sp. NU459]
MGAARGIDEGLISGTFATKNFQRSLGLNTLDEVALANIKGNVSAMVQIGSVAGAALAFILADRIGRLWATRQLCLLWIIGIVIFLTNNGSFAQVYAGRFIAGLGISQTTVIAPVYISEIAPKSVRGLCTCVFAGSVYIGIMLAYFASWGSSLHINKLSPNSWVVPTTIHIMFAGIILILSFFNYESPRFLVKRGQVERAITNLARCQLHEEEEATLGQGVLGYLKEMFCMPNNFYRIYLGLGSQLLSQWSGAQSMTIYAPDFFALLGTKGQNEKLFATAIFGVVKFIIGIGLQALSMGYIACFLTAVPGLASEADFVFTPAQKHASTGAIVMIYLSGFGWAMVPTERRDISIEDPSGQQLDGYVLSFRAVPSMLLDTSDGGLPPKGTFWLFTVITVIGGVWVWFFLPETAGRSLESMDELFKLPWYRIGRFGQQEAEINDQFAREKVMDEKRADVEILEHAEHKA